MLVLCLIEIHTSQRGEKKLVHTANRIFLDMRARNDTELGGPRI